MTRLYHLVVVRVHPKTGERIDDREDRMTHEPCTHREAMVIRSKWTPYRGARLHTACVLQEVV